MSVGVRILSVSVRLSLRCSCTALLFLLFFSSLLLQYVWAPHPLHVWVPAQLVSSDGGVSEFRTQSGESIALADDRAAQLERVSEQSLVSHQSNPIHCRVAGSTADRAEQCERTGVQTRS